MSCVVKMGFDGLPFLASFVSVSAPGPDPSQGGETCVEASEE